jgi:cystathionine beta-lyase family protein involved in aluminum resistance
MPGYNDQVIMAAGNFTQGSSIELSADGPLHAPYTAFLQGGLTYEAGKIGILSAARELTKN